MLKALTGAALLATALSTPSMAAANWDGFYVGAVGTVGVMSSDNTVNSSFFEGQQSSLSDWGGGIGATVGNNWQDGSWVFGLEGDFSWTSYKNSNSVTDTFDTTDTEGFHSSTKWNWVATVRGRFGVDVDDTLIYATGGIAFVGVKNYAAFTENCPTCDDGEGFTENENFSSSKTQVGIALGAGIERHFADSWSFKAEFLYIGLPSTTNNTFREYEDDAGTITNTTCSTCGLENTSRSSAEVFRIGINYALN
jgi:outer membrane immunogenic protein